MLGIVTAVLLNQLLNRDPPADATTAATVGASA
jgi:hypothetical protein